MRGDWWQPLAAVANVVLFYLALGVTVSVGLTLARARRVSQFAGFAVAVVLAFVAGIELPVTPDWRLGAASAVPLVVAVAIFMLRVRPSLTWQEAKVGRENVRQTVLHLVLLTGSVIFVIPFAWLVITSLKEDKEMSKFPPVWIPTQQVKTTLDGKQYGLATTDYKGHTVTVAVLAELDTGQRNLEVIEPPALKRARFTRVKEQLTEIRHFAPVWKNYPDALKFLPPEAQNGLVFLGNTLQISVLNIIGTLLASSMVAYSFARLRWPGRDSLFVVLLATMMLPSAVTMMPVFLVFRWLGWVNTLKPLWVPAFLGSAFNIFLLRQFFLGIPTELEDAAKIDGCSYFGIYWRIMLPQIKPALAALTIMSFMASWNDFRGPLIYISSPQREPLAYALQLFQTSHGGEPGLLMAASTMVMIPVLLLFFFTQRYFIQGITLTGIKG